MATQQPTGLIPGPDPGACAVCGGWMKAGVVHRHQADPGLLPQDEALERGMRVMAELQPILIEIPDVPPSLNAFNKANHWMFYTNKKHWQAMLAEALTQAGMQPAARVVVEGEVTFPDRRKRDQGNYRYMLEKALGDALVRFNWLDDDDWERYSFGNLAARYEKGVRLTRLMIFPTPKPLE